MHALFPVRGIKRSDFHHNTIILAPFSIGAPSIPQGGIFPPVPAFPTHPISRLPSKLFTSVHLADSHLFRVALRFRRLHSFTYGSLSQRLFPSCSSSPVPPSPPPSFFILPPCPPSLLQFTLWTPACAVRLTSMSFEGPQKLLSFHTPLSFHALLYPPPSPLPPSSLQFTWWTPTSAARPTSTWPRCWCPWGPCCTWSCHTSTSSQR